MGRVRQLPNGKYQADVRDHFGKRHRERFEQFKYAKAYVNKIEHEKNEHKLTERGLVSKRSSIENSITEFLITKLGLKEKSMKKYKRVIKQFNIFCSKEKIEHTKDFTRDHADKYWSEMTRSSTQPKTVNFYLMVVRSLFNYEINRDRLIRNPFSHIKPVKEKVKSQIEREEEYYHNNEISAFFRIKMINEDRQVFTALFLTGNRISELQSLRWESSIDLKEKLIKVRNYEEYETKTTTSERDIPMTDHLYNMLVKMKKDEGYVFATVKGERVKERTLLSTCKKIAEQAGITKNATLHKWRHSFASHLASTEITYEERQYLLGHAPASMTDRYTKIDPKTLHAKLSELDKLIK